MLRSENGAASVLSLVVTAIAFISLAGLMNVRIQWRIRVREQFRLDRCVENKALLLEKIQNRIQTSNLRMFAERAAALAAAIPSAGQSLKAVRPVLEIERVWQEAQIARWRIEQTKWIVKMGCDGKSERPHPALRYFTSPPYAQTLQTVERQRVEAGAFGTETLLVEQQRDVHVVAGKSLDLSVLALPVQRSICMAGRACTCVSQAFTCGYSFTGAPRYAL